MFLNSTQRINEYAIAWHECSYYAYPSAKDVTRSDEAHVRCLNVAMGGPMFLEIVSCVHFLRNGADIFLDAIDAAAGVDRCGHILHHPAVENRELHAVADVETFGPGWHLEQHSQNAGEERQGHTHHAFVSPFIARLAAHNVIIAPNS
jgi:hypothetical protein